MRRPTGRAANTPLSGASTAVTLTLLLLASPAFAHHGVTTARVGSDRGWTPIAGPAATEKPQFNAALMYQFARFASPREGNSRYDRIPLGNATAHMTAAELGVAFPSRTQLSVQLPVGAIRTVDGDDNVVRRGGVGDASLTLAQSLLPRTSGTALTGRAGIVAPTGRYTSAPQLSVVDVSAGDGGEINTATYNTSASLGAGVWSATAGLHMVADTGERLSIEADLSASVPLNRTPDDIRWGASVRTLAGVQVAASGRVTGRAAAAFTHHTKDHTPDPVDEATAYQRTGGRDTIAAVVGLRVLLSERTECTGDLQVPVWRRVGGVQLTQTVGATVGCRVYWGR